MKIGKWVNDDKYKAFEQAYENWNKLLNMVLGENAELKAEDVTVEVLMEAFDSRASELQEQLGTAQDELKQKDKQIEQLQSDVAELKGTPVTKQSEAKVDKEPGADAEDIKDFAEKNSDDTLAIMAEASKTGFFKHN